MSLIRSWTETRNWNVSHWIVRFSWIFNSSSFDLTTKSPIVTPRAADAVSSGSCLAFAGGALRRGFFPERLAHSFYFWYLYSRRVRSVESYCEFPVLVLQNFIVARKRSNSPIPLVCFHQTSSSLHKQEWPKKTPLCKSRHLCSVVSVWWWHKWLPWLFGYWGGFTSCEIASYHSTANWQGFTRCSRDNIVDPATRLKCVSIDQHKHLLMKSNQKIWRDTDSQWRPLKTDTFECAEPFVRDWFASLWID